MGPDQTDRATQASLAIFERADDLAGAALARRELGFLRWARGAGDEAVEHWQRSADLAGRAGDHSGVAHDRAWILTAGYFGSTPARQLVHDAVEALSAVDDVPSAMAEVLWTVSGAWAMLGDLEQARTAMEESQRIEAALGRAFSASHFGSQIEAQIQRFGGRLQPRVEALRRGVSEAEALGQRGNPVLRALLAEAYADVGADQQAMDQARSAREAAAHYDGADAQQSVTHNFLLTPALRAEATVLARRGEDAEALARARDVLETLGQTDFYWFTADALMTLADVHRLGGRRGEAAKAAGHALERYEHKHIRLLADEARRKLADLRL